MLAVIEGIATGRDFLILLSLLSVWGLIAWSWRAGRPSLAWAGTAFAVGVAAWAAHDALSWWNNNMSPWA